jgi:predicted N-acetyltransferase YhbS
VPKLSKPHEITRDHNIAGFSCGKPELDEWLERRALKSHASGDSRVFVITNESDEVVAYVAISAASVVRNEATSKLRRNAPDPIPMGLIARLAVRSDMKEMGVGPALLREAVFRIVNASEQIGIRGILVHAMDAGAMSFYKHMGFHSSPIDEMTLMVSMNEIQSELIRGAENGLV